MTEPKRLTDLMDATVAWASEATGRTEDEIRDEIGRDTDCGHRYCQRQRYGLCMGVAGARMDMLEDNGWPERQALNKVVSQWWVP